MQISSVKPLYNNVLIQVLTEEETTKSGIIIPESVKEKPQKAKVIKVGSGTLTEPMMTKRGDTIVFNKYAGIEIEIDGDKYLMIKTSDILAII